MFNNIEYQRKRRQTRTPEEKAKIAEQKRQHRINNPNQYKNNALHRYYGPNFGLIEYNDMLVKQNNVCALCNKPFNGQTPFVDHCHKTGKIRGLVHNKCNLLIDFYERYKDVIPLCEPYLNK